MKKLSENEVRINQAFNTFPFSGTARCDRISPDKTVDENHAIIAANLEGLRKEVQRYVSEYNTITHEYTEMQRDINGLRRIIGVS